MGSGSEFPAQLGGALARHRLIVVSNREPFVHELDGERTICNRPAGGLTAALDPLLRACGGVWLAHGSGRADWRVVDRNFRVAVPPDHPRYTLRRVWIPERLHSEYYSGLANRGLWPLCHDARQQPRFCASEWKSYRVVNSIFACAVLEEAAGEPATVFIQDYHLALLPRMLKRWNPRLTLAHFWHIPWPTADRFRSFPWKEELLDGMLGNDLLGFHLRQYCCDFLDAVRRETDARVDVHGGRVVAGSNVTAVQAFPMGIDFRRHCEIADSSKTRAAVEAWKRATGDGVRVGIGIDRIDYTKGIPNRIRALDLFLEQHPEWRGKLVFVQVGAPSRTEIPEYGALLHEIEAAVAAVNARWSTRAWQPIQLVRRNLPAEEMIALHRIAAFSLVTPLHDGMNLVAKEFVASRADLDGVLILSRYAGAAGELTSALHVNPYCESEIAGAIFSALHLAPEERRQRMSQMRATVQANDVYHWAAAISSALAQTEAAGRDSPVRLPAFGIQVDRFARSVA